MPPVDLLRGGAARSAPPRVLIQGPNLPPIITARAPAPTRQQVAAATYRAAPPRYTKPVYVPSAPPPPRALTTANNPRGVAIIQPSRGPTVNDRHVAALAAAPFHDAGPTGDYGTAAANAFKQTDAYKQSVLEVFLHQKPYQRQAIVSGALHNTVSPEAKMILDYVKRTGGGPAGGSNLVPAAAYGSVVRTGLPPLSGVGKVVQNAARDIVTMPSGTLEGLYSLGKQGVEAASSAATGDWSGALSHTENIGKQIGDPFVQLAEHPLRTFEQHPVNTLLMASGIKSLLGRSIGAAGRAAGADWASTERAPLSLGTVSGEPIPHPLVEYRNYSKDAINQAIQRSREKAIRARGQNPNIARPVPSIPFTHTPVLPQALRQAFNVGPEAKLRRVGDEMAAIRETLNRAERGRVLKDAHNARPKTKEARDIVTHILQGVIRSPGTAIGDIEQEVRRLLGVRTHSRSEGGLWNKRQVRDLERAAATPGALEQAFAAAEKIRPTINGQDTYLEAHRILTPGQLEAKYFPYAQAHMNAVYDHAAGRLVNADHPDGIPIDAIRAHLDANGIPDPAYVGHYSDKAVPGKFWSPYRLARGTLSRGKRTGAAFRKGTYDHTYEGLAAQLANRATTLTRVGLHDKVISRAGILKPPELVAQQVRETLAQARRDIRARPGQQHVITAKARKEVASLRTGMYTPAEARAAAHASLHEDYGNRIGSELELTPITASSQKTIDWVKDIQDPNRPRNISDIEVQALARAIDDASGRTDGVRNVVLAPTALTDRLADQFRPRERGLAKRSIYQFRNTVLPFSTHWMFQIGSEAAIRAALAGAVNPRDLATGRALMHRLMETEQGRAAMAEATGHGGFYSQRGTMGIHHEDNPLVAGAKATLPGRAIIKAYNGYGDFVSKSMGGLEHNFRLMGLGKLAHGEVRGLGNQWRNALRLQGQVLERLASGLEADPALVAKFGRQIDHMFGQYSKYSPKVRAAIQSYAPFLPWYLTATKYVFWQLPVHHPVASALLASLRQTINQDVADGKQQPLNAFATQALGTLSPFGIFTPQSGKPADVASELVQKGVSTVLPQAQGPFLALAGDNPFFGRLVGPHGDVKGLSPQALSTAVESGAEAFIPLATKLRQTLEGGRPSYGTSAIWSPQPKPGGGPGDLSQVLNRTLNPFYSFLRAKNAKRRVVTGSGGGGAGGGGGGAFGPTLSPSSGGFGPTLRP